MCAPVGERRNVSQERCSARSEAEGRRVVLVMLPVERSQVCMYFLRPAKKSLEDVGEGWKSVVWRGVCFRCRVVSKGLGSGGCGWR